MQFLLLHENEAVKKGGKMSGVSFIFMLKL